MNTTYSPFSESNTEDLQHMILSLYAEDPDGGHMTLEKINRTTAFLASHPGAGDIVLMMQAAQVVGYSILINYWSNEYGGLVLFIDELYIKKEFRGQHIGSDFIQHLLADVTEQYQSVVLEVIPDNKSARRLYNRLGFRQAKNDFLRYEIKRSM